MCIACGNRDHVSDNDARGGAGIGAQSSAPTFTIDQIVTQLQTQWGGDEEGRIYRWTDTSLTYAMPDGAPTNFGGETPSEAAGLDIMTPGMRDRARLAFELWDDLIATSLTESVGNRGAQITFNYSSTTSGGGTYAQPLYNETDPDRTFIGQQVWMNSNWSTHDQPSDLVFGGYGFQTYLHEVGHTLGLSHPGSYNAGGGADITYANSAEFAQDNRQFTIMSYFGGYDAASNTWTQDGTSASHLYSSTPMLFDVASIQGLYGADMTTRTGDTVYGFNSTAGRAVFDFGLNFDPIFTIWDAGGTDTLDTSRFSMSQTINLAAGTYSDIGGFTGNIAIAYGATVENARGGSGADTIHGNEVANLLTGNNGNDTLDGGAGSDTLDGGEGDDTLYFDAADNLANVLGGNGFDTLLISNGAAPTSFDLAGHQFEQAIAHVSETGNQSWDTRTDTYTAGWQLSQSNLVNDDGSSILTTNDLANTHNWAQTNNSYNAAAQTTQQSVRFDDNTSQTNSFDPTNVQSWSHAHTYYDAASRTTHQSVAFDDATSRTTYFDATGAQSWSRADTSYDTAGQTTLQSVANDDGSSLAHYWDTTDSNPWSKATHYYDAAGNRTITTVINDDGSTFAF